MSATYLFRGKDKNGKITTGTMAAENKNEVARSLKKQGLFVISINEKREAKDFSSNVFQKRKAKFAELVVFARQMATMIESGLTIVDTLEILKEQSRSPILRETTAKILQDVEEGKSFYAAVAAHPKIFPTLFRQMIKAGEEGGILENVLDRVAIHYEKEMALTQKVKAALMYPAVIVIVAVIVVFFLMAIVIPNFVNMFAGMGQTLPLPTRVIIAISGIFQSFWWVFILLIAAGLFALKLFYNQPQGKRMVDNIKLKMPIFGNLQRKVVVARFARTLSTLTNSGVTILEGVNIVKDVVGNQVIAEVLMESNRKIREGIPLSKPLRDSKQFPAMVIQMIAIGEETGTTDKMLGKVADFYEQEVDATVTGLVSLIEPVLIVGIAVVVGLIVLSIVLPMFEMITAF